MKSIVCDTGALISLEKIKGGYSFIQHLYSKLIIPPKVLDEISFDYSSPQEYLEAHQLNQFVEVVEEFPVLSNLADLLDDGEIEAISLAQFLNLELLIEERDGRKIAQQLGIEISGIGCNCTFRENPP